MKVLIIVSFVLAAFVLIIINRLSKHPSKRDVKLEGNLLEETGSIEYEFQKQIRREKIEKVIRYTIAYLLLSIAAFFVLFPFYWMFATSVKSAQEVMKMPPTIIPQDPQFSNFAVAMQRANFSRYLVNTLIVAVFSTIGTLVTTVTSAFAFSRLSFKGRDLTFAIFIATMMIPGEMMVITNFITVTKTFKMYNTYSALIIPFWVSTYYIFLLRNTFRQIPDELYYAAKVDGTSDFKYLLKVMLPIASPTIITITILKLMGAWNSYIWPNLVCEEEMRLITNGLRGSFDSADGTTVHLQMAATTIVTVPLLLVFIFFRKYIMRGVSRSGIKG